jgi:hypothetical protein
MPSESSRIKNPHLQHDEPTKLVPDVTQDAPKHLTYSLENTAIHGGKHDSRKERAAMC